MRHKPDPVDLEGLPNTESLWPFLKDKPPRIVYTVRDFVKDALFGHHEDMVTVLPNGIQLLHQDNAIPEGLWEGIRKSSRVAQLFVHTPDEVLDSLKGRLWQYNEKGKESEIKKADKVESLSAVMQCWQEGVAEGTVVPNAPLYITEVRKSKSSPHPITGDNVKTATLVDVYDVVPQRALVPLWERSEGGIFIGERGAGSGLHVDQCLWSNIGKQYSGYKLFALWPWSERTKILEDAKRGSVFHFPLTDEEIGFLSRASVVALLKPGDVFVFSGGVPHMAMCVGDTINVGAYESIVPLNHLSVGRLARTNSKDHFRKCWMDDDDLDELLEDIVDSLAGNLNDTAIDIDTRVELEKCEAAMREHGDSYTRRLWKREENRRKRRLDAPNVDRDAPTLDPSDCVNKRARLH